MEFRSQNYVFGRTEIFIRYTGYGARTYLWTPAKIKRMMFRKLSNLVIVAMFLIVTFITLEFVFTIVFDAFLHSHLNYLYKYSEYRLKISESRLPVWCQNNVIKLENLQTLPDLS